MQGEYQHVIARLHHSFTYMYNVVEVNGLTIFRELEALSSKYYIHFTGHDKRGLYCRNEQ